MLIDYGLTVLLWVVFHDMNMFYVISKDFVCDSQLHFDSFGKMPAKLAAHASTDSYLSEDAHVPVAQVGEGEPEG